MKKLYFLGIMMILSVLSLNAQQKVKELVPSEYNRPSVSYVFVNRSQAHATDVERFYYTLEVDEKFDENHISTKLINVEHSDKVPTSSTNVTAAVNSNNLGKEIISYIFNRKSDGTFDDSILQQRGLYNANDQDMQNLAAAKVKEQALEWGQPLVNTAYVVVVDIYDTSISKDGSNTSYSVKSVAHAYKLKGDEDVLNNFYEKAWADASYSEADKLAASAAYDQMKFQLDYQTTVTALGTSSDSSSSTGSIYDACLSAYEDIVYKLEKTVNGWKSNAAVISTRPIAAKIGTKEGIKNGSRFQSYSYKEDRKGNLVSVKHGMVRATVVANNSRVATGQTKPSYFYQISGVGKVKDGYILQQKNDLKLGVALTAGVNAIGFRGGLDMDYIAHIAKFGGIAYGMVNLGFNVYQSNEDLEDAFNKTLVDAQIGLGYGVPLTRFVEITPFVTGGALLDLNKSNDEESEYYSDDEEEKPSKIAGYVAEPGVRIAATFQPLSIFVSAGYQAYFAAQEETMLDVNSGVFVKFGVKWTF